MTSVETEVKAKTTKLASGFWSVETGPKYQLLASEKALKKLFRHPGWVEKVGDNISSRALESRPV